MSEMVERVAAAMFESSGGSWGDCLRSPGQIMAKVYRGIAEVAIQAMREPTEAMVDAPNHQGQLGGYGYGDDVVLADATKVWQTMIDEALK